MPIEWRIYGHDPSRGGQPGQDEYVDGLLAEVRRAGLADRFRLAGFHADPAEIMAQIDLLVHPAESESFGRVIVEGMAAGLPVVGVAAGGVGEIVRHEETGLLAPPGAADVMARYITRLVRDPDLRNRYGAAGCRRAHECYSLRGLRRRRHPNLSGGADGFGIERRGFESCRLRPSQTPRPRPTIGLGEWLIAPIAPVLKPRRRVRVCFRWEMVSRA